MRLYGKCICPCTRCSLPTGNLHPCFYFEGTRLPPAGMYWYPAAEVVYIFSEETGVNVPSEQRPASLHTTSRLSPAFFWKQPYIQQRISYFRVFQYVAAAAPVPTFYALLMVCYSAITVTMQQLYPSW